MKLVFAELWFVALCLLLVSICRGSQWDKLLEQHTFKNCSEGLQIPLYQIIIG